MGLRVVLHQEDAKWWVNPLRYGRLTCSRKLGPSGKRFRLGNLRDLALVGLFLLASGTAASDPSRSYTLVPDSDFEVGCFDPCACPILIQSPLQGGFTLSPTGTAGPGPGIVYDVTDLAWVVRGYDRDLSVTGSGTYRIVPESPRLHQMTLDLSVDGQPRQVFDSGLVPGGEDLSAIRIRISTGGEFCWDSVFTVHATGAVAGVPPGELAFLAARPNPFHASTVLLVRLAGGGSLDVRVHDAQGRVVRVLARAQPLEGGIHPFTWDGLREDGSAAPAGLYFVRAVSAGDRSSVQTLVRLR
jgi:hypothetical protein